DPIFCRCFPRETGKMLFSLGSRGKCCVSLGSRGKCVSLGSRGKCCVSSGVTGKMLGVSLGSREKMLWTFSSLLPLEDPEFFRIPILFRCFPRESRKMWIPILFRGVSLGSPGKIRRKCVSLGIGENIKEKLRSNPGPLTLY
ncbi:hypothetical protein L9F63_015436, partial [Diploptera punctata]